MDCVDILLFLSLKVKGETVLEISFGFSLEKRSFAFIHSESFLFLCLVAILPCSLC